MTAHDRRRFGRSSRPGHGDDYDTFADDLAALVQALDLKDVALVGHSMGGGEVARHVGRQGEGRVAKAALVAAVTSFPLKTENHDRPGAEVSQEVRDDYRRQGMTAGILAAFRDDLKKINIPTLIVHGGDDQIVPIEISGLPTSKLVGHARLLVYEGGSHGLIITHKDRLNTDLLTFLSS